MTEVASTPDQSPELVDLSKVKEKLTEFIQGGQLSHGVMLLEQISRWPDSTRYLSDNLWLYGKLGDLQRALEQEDDAMTSYQRAFELDPRNLNVLRPYSDLLFHNQKNEEGLKVVQAMLLHHKRQLSDKEVVGIYRQLGTFYEGLGKFEKAQTSFEKALEQDPMDQVSLSGLLRVVGQIGEPLDVIRVRQKLIRTLDDPIARSHALMALGDDWALEFNDPGRALDVYEQALIENPQNKKVIEKIARVGSEVGDWRRVSRAYFTLSQIAETPAEQAEWIVRSSEVARDELWESDKALAGFRRALELDPSRLDAFKAVTSILVDAKDWEGLETAYVQLISANVEAGNNDAKLMYVLWQKLAEVYKLHLNRDQDAVFAYGQAAAQVAQGFDMHAEAADIAEKNPELVAAAIEHLKAMYKERPDRLDVLERLGRVYLKQKDVDRAWNIYRVLAHKKHPLDEKASQFVARFNTALFRPIKNQFTSDMLNNHIFSKELDANVSEVFRILKPALEEWTGEATSKWGLKRKNRVNLDEPLAFNRIYKSVGSTLGYQNLPELWYKPEQEGIVNGALVPEGMIAGDDILASGREEYTAFIVGKQLFLFLAPFYLAAIRPATDLQAFFMLAVSLVHPERPIDLTKESEQVLKHMKKKIKGPAFDQLKSGVDKASRYEVDLVKWLNAVEDTANRVGLIFCDDLDAAREYLQNEPQKIGNRSVDQRMDTLISYSISSEYLELRSRIGHSLNAG